ncbi:MAG: tetratricopeptide repeat protein [Candidatus Omnitrophota bacterium]
MRRLIAKSDYFNLFAVIALCLLGIIIYSNTFWSPFQFDSETLVGGKTAIKNIANLDKIWQLWSTRFITFLSFALNYHFHGFNVFGYHFVNIAIHIASAILVWYLVKLILRTPALREDTTSKYSHIIAFFTALIFVSHPVQTEAVTYIYQRSTALAAFFYIASICLYLKTRLLQGANVLAARWRRYYCLSWVLAIAGMFTKENVVTLPLMIVLCEYCFFKASGYRDREYSLFYLALLPIIPLLLFLTSPPVFIDLDILSDRPVLGGEYLLTQLRVVITYLRLFFVPLNQNLDYDYPIIGDFKDPSVLLSFFVLLTIIIIAVRIFPRRRLLSFSIFWFFLCLIPESTIIPLRDVIFEHRLYLPMVGYSIFIVTGLVYLLKEERFKFAVAIISCIAVIYSVMTYCRNNVWKDKVSLWNDVVRKSPQKARVYSHRGKAFLDNKEYKNALVDLNRALLLDSLYPEVYNQRGVLFARRKEYDEAIADFNKALDIHPYFVEVYNNRGAVFLDLREYDKAIDDFGRALEICPDYVNAYSNLGVAFVKKEEYEKAINQFNRALQLDPKCAEAYNNRGSVFLDMGEYDKAINDFNRALRIDPVYEEIYIHRGMVFVKKKEYAKAIADFNQALRIDPDSALAYNYRGLVFSNEDEYDKAMADFNQALRIESDHAEVYNRRGKLFVKKKEYDKAMADFNQALQIDPNYPYVYNNRGMLFLMLQEYEQALSDFNKALQIFPDYAEAYNHRGMVYINKQEYSKAIADFKQALKIDWSFDEAYMNLGSAYGALGKYDETIEYSKTAILLNPKLAFAYNNLVLAYYFKKEPDKAVEFFDKAATIGLKLDSYLIKLLNPYRKISSHEDK